MRVPARVFADPELLEAIRADRSLEQLQNVATLPGVVGAALAMPDIHQGYGFPVGGLAATEPPDGVISPGGVGYDINCGVRLLVTAIAAGELGDRKEPLVHEISRLAPAGAGREAALKLNGSELDRVLRDGPAALMELRGIGTQDDVEQTESRGQLGGADPDTVSERARQRGSGQLGTVGSGNHFIEVQRVDRVLDEQAAQAYGLELGAMTVLIHSGSRGLGHQVCTDYVKRMDAAVGRHGIELPDRQLACAPLSAPEARDYLGAMAAATSPGPTAPRSRTRCARRSAACWATRPPTAPARCTTWPTTSPSSSLMAAGSYACIERVPPAPSLRATSRSRPGTWRRGSLSSYRGRWAPPASCWLVARDPWNARSAPPAMARDAV